MNPHTITIVNTSNNKGAVTFYPTVLKGVHFQDKQTVRTGTTEHFTDNEGYVQIPHNVTGYIDPEKWNQLTDKTGKWTLKESDYIVKGDTINQDKPLETMGLRTIKSHENIDYGIILEGHYGVYLK